MINYKYILILNILSYSFYNSYDKIIEKIESHSTFSHSKINCVNLKDIVNNIRKYDESIETLECDLVELKSILSKYIITYQNENILLTDSLAKMFYISRYIKYGIPVKEKNYIRYIVLLKSILKYYQSQHKFILDKINFLKNLKAKIINKIRNIKKSYDLLNTKAKELTFKSSKNLLSDKLLKIQNASRNICNIKDLINELETEEYIGELKNIITKHIFNNKLKFTYPCKYIDKKISNEIIVFFTKPTSKIFASEDGIVVFLGKLQGKSIIVIKHNKSFKSIISGDIVSFMNIGDIVHKNQEIGQVNDSVNDLSFLEFKIIKDGRLDNPCKYFKN